MSKKVVFTSVLLGVLAYTGVAAASHHTAYDREHRRDHAACEGKKRSSKCHYGHPSSMHYYYHHDRHGHHGMKLD